MKNMFLSAAIALCAFAGVAYATNEKADPRVNPKYNHRVTALQSSLSYERIADDAVYFGFDSFVAPAWRKLDDNTLLGAMELRAGYSFSLDSATRIIPVAGLSIMKDLETQKVLVDAKDTETRAMVEQIYHSPSLFHGFLGVMGEYDLNRTVSLGVSLKGMLGKHVGTTVEHFKDLSYGLNVSVPVTLHFGNTAQWDLRFEPYTYVLEHASNYSGLKSAVGYRF